MIETIKTTSGNGDDVRTRVDRILSDGDLITEIRFSTLQVHEGQYCVRFYNREGDIAAWLYFSDPDEFNSIGSLLSLSGFRVSYWQAVTERGAFVGAYFKYVRMDGVRTFFK